MSPTILTSQGFEFNFTDVGGLANCYDIDDIAHALSHLCRFTGHTREFYSVAQHSYHVSQIVPTQHALAGLLHDATEAYLGDVSSPLKKLLPAYQAIERIFEAQILESFGLAPTLPPEVKQADAVMLATERRDLMPAGAMVFTPHAEPDRRMVIRAWQPGVAKAMFLRRFKELTQ